RAADELCEIATRFDTEVIVAAAETARGAVELARGQVGEALRSLGSALSRWEHAEVPYQVARMRVLLSRACGAVGDADGEEVQRRAARAELERLGAAPDLAGLSPAGSPASGPASKRASGHGLSPRELEVLKLVAAGHTNRAIAKVLSVSVKTVDRHVSNIFTKLDVSSRAAATAYAYEHGLV
ncbi:MAG: response regulator transcription factor, partial [Myxococcales bacterium]